uniref:Tyrosine specific protein phosphatases domain-containing protein n=1 Tax=Amphimedon queenslandica TaxID=400682 RepID=A0A1X7U3Y2_AMPQE
MFTSSQDYTVNLSFVIKPAFCGMLKLLLSHEENLPVLIHCVYGKDRTGVLVALILDCIGVERETIAMDYASSEEWCSIPTNGDVLIATATLDYTKGQHDTIPFIMYVSTCSHPHDGLVSMRNEMYDDLIVNWGMAEHSCQAKADTMLKVLKEIDK